MLRVFLGFVVAGLALGAAVWLDAAKYGHTFCVTQNSGPGIFTGAATAPTTCDYVSTAWQRPGAVTLAVIGIGAEFTLVVSGLRRPQA